VSEAGGLGDKTIVTLITLVVFLGGENISSQFIRFIAVL
jgi:hypothetical protein